LNCADYLGQPLAVVDCGIHNELQFDNVFFELPNAVYDHISVNHVAFLQKGHEADKLIVVKLVSILIE
jgi:hypothetical protein